MIRIYRVISATALAGLPSSLDAQSRSSRVQTPSCSRFTGNFGTGE